MSPELGLPSLLAALREAGLSVGVAELARLQAVFSRQPALGSGEKGEAVPAARLGGLLAALLVKSGEDRQIFERVFAAWLERSEADLRERETPTERPPLPSPRPVGQSPSRRKPRWSAAAACLLLVIVAAVDRDARWSPPEGSRKVVPPSPPPLQRLAPADVRQRTFTPWVPTLEVLPGPGTWSGWPAFGLGVLSLAAAGELWRRLRGKSWMPERTSLPPLPGPPRVFLSPPALRGAQLLSQREQETLVWGIGRYVSEEPTRRLDLPATVRATARSGGLPELRFERARYPREVWIWTDETADDPALGRLADEIEALLRLYGLPVERARFRGLPERLVAADGQVFAPNELDERRDLALVAVLTDGRILGYQWAAPDRRVRVEALLRGLSSWPRLTVVDFSDGAGELPRILARHGLSLLAPEEVARFLGGAATSAGSGGTVRAGALPGQHGDTAWAAVCALGPSPVAEETAFELRERLGLATSPWALRALREEAPGPPGRLQWSPSPRARLLNWLRSAEGNSLDGKTPSLLGRALDAWDSIYRREMEARSAAAGVAPWEGTPAAERLAMERALLKLWRRPEEAARELYRLYRGRLAESIGQHLSGLLPDGWNREGKIGLPWPWDPLPAAPKVMLQEMGFGRGVLPALVLGRSSRLRLGVALGLGLGLGALVVAAGSGIERTGRPSLTHGKGKPADAREWIEPYRANWSVTVATRTASEHRIVPPGSRVTVRWKQRPKRDCIARQSDGTEIWRCGSLAQPAVLSGTIEQSVAFLGMSPGAPEVDALALALLDSGSADTVVVGLGWEKALPTLSLPWAVPPDAVQLVLLTGPSKPEAREIVELLGGGAVRFVSLELLSARWADLAAALSFDSSAVKSIHEVWPQARVLSGDPGKVFLRGLGTGGCRPVEETDANGFAFIRICPGSFRMGSPESESDAFEDERPAHEVTLSEFSLGKYEVTNREYRRLHPEHRGEDDLPAIGVRWEEAQAFCQHYGYRLPTEAEWEYACRAGTTTRWSFGDDPRKLGDYAWFDKNAGGKLHPVGTRAPNPWGIYDLHGNAAEWVADWFGTYSPASQRDPTRPPWDMGRVLRGGSFFNSPRDVRSTTRIGVEPSVRIEFLGFRCGRGSRRQP
jgi:formylglycine-generating enzyme required for sulfatase activity